MLATRLKKRCVDGGRSKRSESRDLRFSYVALACDGAQVVCKLNNGALYELPLKHFSISEEYDGSAPISIALAAENSAAVVRFETGVELDFPVDFVLHHCEPSYPFFVGKISNSNTIGKNIRYFRESRDLTLGELSRITGIAGPNLSRLEHGKHLPSVSTLQTLANGLGVPGSALLTRRQVVPSKRKSVQIKCCMV